MKADVFFRSTVYILISILIVSCSTHKDQPLPAEPLPISFMPQGPIPSLTDLKIPQNARIIFAWAADNEQLDRAIRLYSETSHYDPQAKKTLTYPNTAKYELVFAPGGKALHVRVRDGFDSNFGMKNFHVPDGLYRIEIVACFATQPNGRGPSFRFGFDGRLCDGCRSDDSSKSTHIDAFGTSVRSLNGDWKVASLSSTGPYYAEFKEKWINQYNLLPNPVIPDKHRWVVGWTQFLGNPYPGAEDIREGGDGFLAWMIVWIERI